MPENLSQPNWLQRLNHRIASQPWAARLFSYAFHHLDRPIIDLSHGRTSPTSWLTGLPIVTLTTLGAKSGERRSVPVVGTPVGDKTALIASNWGQSHHPARYFNLRADPEAELAWSRHAQKYLTPEAAGQEYEDYWDRAVGLYAGYAAYKERTGGRKIPIMVLAPISITGEANRAGELPPPGAR